MFKSFKIEDHLNNSCTERWKTKSGPAWMIRSVARQNISAIENNSHKTLHFTPWSFNFPFKYVYFNKLNVYRNFFAIFLFWKNLDIKPCAISKHDMRRSPCSQVCSRCIRARVPYTVISRTTRLFIVKKIIIITMCTRPHVHRRNNTSAPIVRRVRWRRYA
jgi:hypothetical protein